MSNAAVFVLITNDGRADQMIMATSLLHARIDDIRSYREAEGREDVNPTLADIERTHVLFMNATFKPFAAFAFEYQKVQPTGAIDYGNTLKYSIPQSGDFFGDMGIRFTTNSALTTNSTVTWTEDDSVEFYGAEGERIDDAGSVAALVRFADYPGERIVENAKFSVNSNTLHEYTHHASAAFRKFKLPESKKLAYSRLVGQEVPLEGYGLTHGEITDNTGQAGTAGAGHRQIKKVVNGLQTPKTQHDSGAVFWHKCQFWFNRDPRLMVPSVAIPYGQRFVEVTLAAQNRVMGAVATGKVWVREPNNATEDGEAFAEVNLFTGTGPDTDLTLSGAATVDSYSGGALATADLYVNNIYVLPDIHDIYIHRIGFNLIRVTREQGSVATTASQALSQQLHDLKWPIEAMYFGVQITAQATDLANWWKWGEQTRVARASIISNAGAAGANALAGSAADQKHIVDVYAFDTVTRSNGGVTIKLHGSKLYDDMPAEFFSDYMPASYGGSNVTAADDIGSMAVFFGLFPGTYQPNGHINTSRARELYLEMTPTVDGSLRVISDAINFLLISDGNAILRYTT